MQFLLGLGFVGGSLAVMRGALAYLFNRPLVFAETSVDAMGQIPRRAHLRSGAMRESMRYAIVLFATAVVLAIWQVYLYSLPLPADAKPLDWRFHAVWLYPLVLNAALPFLFHPYLIGGPDLPQWLAQRRRRGVSHVPIAPQVQEQAASSQQGVS